MHTIKQIIDNQKTYRALILKWLEKDLSESKKKLSSIKDKDKYIQEQVIKLKNRFKKTPLKKEIDRLFFMHPNRNEKLYVWWDELRESVNILKYGKK